MSGRDLAAIVRGALMMDALTGEEYEDALAALAELEKQAADAQAERDSAIYERNNARIARKAWANSAAVADKRALAAEARAVRAEEARDRSATALARAAFALRQVVDAHPDEAQSYARDYFEALAASGADTP